MVTSDSRTLKNVRGRTANIGTALKNYRGAIATKPFSKTGRFYFEAVVYFFIKRQLRNDLIFEVNINFAGCSYEISNRASRCEPGGHRFKPPIRQHSTVNHIPFLLIVNVDSCQLLRKSCALSTHVGIILYK